MNAQRNFKDTVGRMLFARPENALQLYNALNGTDYTDSSVIEFNTLENAIYLGMKNDLSFIIAYRTSLYEFQSTITPNMPLRNLFYISDILQGYVRNRTLYSSRCIKIPAPRFIVLYNGIRPMPEQVEYKLSDAFEVYEEDPQLELKVTVLNINEGMNEELKSRCPVLKEYMEYVGAVRRNMEHMPLDEAVDAAIEYCIKNNILKDFLLEQKAEVKKMSIYEFDEEREMEMIRQDERAEGEQAGLERGREEGRAEGEQAGLERGREEGRAEGEQFGREQAVLSLCRKFGCSREESIQRLMEECSLTREEAEKRMEEYRSED